MKKLRVLHIEDNEDDSALILRALRKNNFEVESVLVDTSSDLQDALNGQGWDIVLSDHSMPNFDGLSALQQVAKHDPDLPFILVSGAVGEEVAVQLMREGAKDYIMKDHLGRLAPAVERELADSEVRREKNVVKQQKHELEAQLWQAQKMEAIGTLAGGIAHDFNNILTAIIGYSQLAEMDLAELPETKRKVSEVIKAGNRAKELVQHILTFSRQSEEDKNQLEIHLIVKEALKLLRASTPSTIEFKQDISTDSGCINANSTRIHQVIMNLCTNAYHAMSEGGGVLTVSLCSVRLALGELAGQDNPSGSYVKLSVGDTGCGISESIFAKIFDPYFTTKAQGVGTGLGLSLVMGIIKSHDGYITLQSEEGKGTTFNVYFPRVTDVSVAASAISGERLMPVGGTENILVADDEEIIVKFTEEILTILGYKVTVAKNGKVALDLFKAHPENFDLLITDMTMPEMVGTELSRQILEIKPDLPIILCTGHSDKVNLNIAKEIGIKEYRIKPVPGLDLAKIVRQLLDESSSA
jgi:signal transduction histidine kinase